MKKLISKYLSLSILLIGIVGLHSCGDKATFEKTKSGNLKSSSPLQAVASINLRYQPAGFGSMIILLPDGSEFTAKSLSPERVAAIVSLFNSNNLQFDTTAEEFIARRDVQ